MTGAQPAPPLRARCHCGAVELEITLSDGLNSASRCNCSFCMRRGAVAVSAPLGGVTVLRGQDNLTLYSFGTHTAKHHFCKTCGIYTHHQRRLDPNEFGVNAACIEGVHLPDLDPIPWVEGINHPSDQPDPLPPNSKPPAGP